MGTQNCDLTSIGYNLSCATTQNAVNSTMQFYLEEMNSGIDWYYVWDEQTDALVPMTSAQFAQICAVNPLTIPDGANAQVGDTSTPMGQQLNALYAAGFEYGIVSATGINPSWTQIPPIVQFAQLGTSLTYSVFFATMQVLELQEKHGNLTMVHCTQPSDAPWVFSYKVDLALLDATGTPGAPLPQSDLFSVQRLYVNLTESIMGTYPDAITGVSPDCMTTVMTCVNAYLQSIPSAQTTLSYTQQLKGTESPDASIVVTALQYAILPYAENPGLGTLNYLCMSEFNSPPVNVKYPQWTWLETDTASGVMAIERDVFFNYVLDIFNTNFAPLSIQTTADVKGTDQGCSVTLNYSYVQAPTSDAAVWKLNADTTSTTVAQASYRHESSDSYKFGDPYCSVAEGSGGSAYWNYYLTGSLTTSNDADGTAHIVMSLQLQSPGHAHSCGVTKEGNVVDITSVIDYQLSVSASGEMMVVAVPTTTNTSVSFDSFKTSCGKCNLDAWNQAQKQLVDALLVQLESYESAVRDALQGPLAWYFPGSSTFRFRNIAFSNYSDLTVLIDYDKPTPAGAANASFVK